MKIQLIFIFCFLSAFANAKGMIGSYAMSGKAYNSQGELIRNGEITLKIGDTKETIKTDSLGNYQVDVGYILACPSVARGIKRRQVNNELNPKFIQFTFLEQEVRIRNRWRKHMSKGTRDYDILFD